MEQYTKMCRAATEIQEAWEPKEGDMTYVLRANQQLRLSVADIEMVPIYNDYVWLPRIEDLVVMLTPADIGPYHPYDAGASYNVIRAIYGWSSDRGAVFWKRTRGMSLVEIYLCFVMHARHDKWWDGTEWEERDNDL